MAEAARNRSLLNQRIFDAALFDVDRLYRRVPSADKVRLEAQKQALLDARRSAEIAGAPIVSSSAACVQPSFSTIATQSGSAVSAIVDAHWDVIKAAFACDVVRVASLWVGNSGYGFPTGYAIDRDTGSIITQDFHGTSHMAVGPDGAGLAPHLYACNNSFWADKIASLVNKLASVQEGSGTLLDSTLILWTSEFAQGRHNGAGPYPRRNRLGVPVETPVASFLANHPVMFFGGPASQAQGLVDLDPGRWEAKRMLNTLCQFAGVPLLPIADAEPLI